MGEFDGSNSKINEIKPGIDENDLAHMVALYDGEIRYVDDYIKKLLDRLDKLHLMDKTMVVITADHGEEFLEHSGNWHGHTLYDELIHVPLIIYIPGTEGGKVINKQVSTLNILPTILEFLDIPIKQNLEGVSMLYSTQPYKEQVFSHTDTDNRGMSAIRTEKLKYIYSSKENKYQMYDLSQDPKEQNNLTGYGQLQEDQLKIRLFGWLEDCKKIISAQLKDSGSEQTMDQELKERLKSLGYLH
jgi:arylsulfatase A-like enzyme